MEKEFKMINYIKYKKKIASFCTKFRSKIDKKDKILKVPQKKHFQFWLHLVKNFMGFQMAYRISGPNRAIFKILPIKI